MKRLLCALLPTMIVGAALPAAQTPATRAVDVTAPDGTPLRATYYSPGQPGPGIVLFHQCNMTRTAWEGLGLGLAARGVHVLAPDQRGMGDNKAVPADALKFGSDADAALAWLQAQPGVNRDRVGAGGASCGVDRAVQLARRSPAVKALMLLSGPTNDAGMAYLQAGSIPVFFAFSLDEGGPLPEMKRVISLSGRADVVVRELNRAGHGVPMFDADASLMPAIADWFARVLRP